MSESCQTTYHVQVRDWDGHWSMVGRPCTDSSEAVASAREELAEAAYGECALRIVKVHVHQTVTVLQEVAPTDHPERAREEVTG